ncbi:hypothetical protein Rvan_3512 [Rhodomicrobium vannielii ATCC 17100]|jgi:hypothetical protein|uniref:Uncharacterized protein n=2 Tax=Rhodomicrobium TaxID=1068 RepID=E3I443_RHOVT|nr:MULTISPECIES: hypothetical protein [Rhodomicrobium]ADP72692.1 hypothetical protein Rvan_3512 [Rhodomicrobium vannielii ATCC 17100]KAI94229.1 hypothetical protein T281_12140 [Rhodomicrobium udaipurense JA643]MBJ7543669.1 hypothetical protein [Rhodomicrobium udaipurense]
MKKSRSKNWYSSEDWFYDYEQGSGQTLTVHEQEKELFTGLFDAQGNKLYRERQPIGFPLRKASRA